MKSNVYMISHPPTSLIVENEHLFRVTRHMMIQYEQLETKDGEWKDASGGAGNRDGDKWVDMKSYKCMIRDIYDFI
jgi:hypothetical protein